MPVAVIDDRELYWEANGDGRAVMMISGFSADHGYWSAAAEALPRDSRTIVFDNRGVGRSSDSDSPYGISELAGDAIRLADHLRVERMDVCGQSMGTMIAQQLAVERPDLVDRIVLCNPFARMSTPAWLALGFGLELRRSGATAREMTSYFLPWMFSDEYLSSPGRVDSLLSESADATMMSERCFANRMEILERFDSRPWLSGLAQPTLVIAGEEDRLATPAEARTLAQQLPSGEFALLGGGHDLPVERPDAVAACIARFLAGAARPSAASG